MIQDSNPQPRAGLDFISVLFGFAAGIIGTLVFATVKQRPFDRVVDKTRELAGGAGHLVDDISDNARSAATNLATGAHRSVDRAERGTKNAIEAVRSSLTE